MKCTVVMEDWHSGTPVVRYARVFASFPEAKEHLELVAPKWADPMVKGDIIIETTKKPTKAELSHPRYWPGAVAIEVYMSTPLPFEFGGKVITYQVGPAMQSIEQHTFETFVFENYPVRPGVMYAGECKVHHRNQHEARKYHRQLVEMLLAELPTRGTEADAKAAAQRRADMNRLTGLQVR